MKHRDRSSGSRTKLDLNRSPAKTKLRFPRKLNPIPRDLNVKRLPLLREEGKLDPLPLDLKRKRLPLAHQRNLLSREEDKLGPLPLDLEVEILARLPATSLMRFRCVSKMWSSIIRSQRFIDSFFARSSTQSRFTIVVCNGVYAGDDVVKSLFIFSASHEGGQSDSLVANLDMIIPSVTLDHDSRCPSLHGFLACCTDDSFRICNPATGQVIAVPCNWPFTSLGYDPIDDQFKTLTLVSPPPGQKPYRSFLKHEVTTIKGDSWARTKVTSTPHYPVTRGLCINGIVYYAAWAPTTGKSPVIVCFDVRNERISLIPAPKDVVACERDAILIEYRGKLASIVICPFDFNTFHLWILEDAHKPDWSKQTFKLPFPLPYITSPGANKAGEIIFAPKTLSHYVQPFYIFYYNVETKGLRRVRIQGIADTEEFRRRYEFGLDCCVSMSAQHVESIAVV